MSPTRLTARACVKGLARAVAGFFQCHRFLARLEQDRRADFAQLSEQIRLLHQALERREALSAETSCRRKALADDVTDANGLLASEDPMFGRVVQTSGDFASGHGALADRPPLASCIPSPAPGNRRSAIRERLSQSGLFIVGHARSGTSILQMALNTSPDIFLLGEANLHLSANQPGFASWYRAMHESFNNPLTKSTSCPDPDDSAGDAWDVLLSLRERYRFVGDKMAYRSRKLGYDFPGSYRFLQDYFPGAHIIGTLRHPRDVLGSNVLMFGPHDISDYLVSYLECLALEVDLVCTFDRATILVHERIRPETFTDLGRWLDCDLGNAYGRCYERHFSGPRHAAPSGLQADQLAIATHYYERLCRIFENAPLALPLMTELWRIRHDLGADIKRLTERDASLRISMAQAAD
jgi:hypothetical protein